jgi:transposase-like protein
VPKPFPTEFRRDVIAVARQGEQSIAQVARSLGISESCLNRWLKIADRQDGISAGRGVSASTSSSGEKDLEAENLALRRRTKTWSQNQVCRYVILRA